MNNSISVIIHTLNEEKNIRNCLESVKWADEIIIVDMYSDDNTIEIAREYTDKIYYYERVGYADPARKFGLDKATNEWVLVVDADELVPRKLRDYLLQVTKTDQYDAVIIPRLNYFFGYAMRGTGWGPLQDLQIRFFKKQFMNYSDTIHAFATLESNTRVLKLMDHSCAFIHFNYIDAEHFIEKLNRYTTIEAKNSYDKGEPFSLIKAVYKIIKEFCVRFMLKRGYRDGIQGFFLAYLMSAYRASCELKLHILQKYPNRELIHKEYEDITQAVIKEYNS